MASPKATSRCSRPTCSRPPLTPSDTSASPTSSTSAPAATRSSSASWRACSSRTIRPPRRVLPLSRRASVTSSPAGSSRCPPQSPPCSPRPPSSDASSTSARQPPWPASSWKRRSTPTTSRPGTVSWSRPTTATHRFVHALVQEVVLERLPAGRASRLHGAVAQLLEQEGASSPAVVATHTWAARDVLGPAAVESQLAAADAATAVCAHEQAEVHLRRALHLVRQASPPDPDAELSVLLTLLRLIITSRGWGDHDARERSRTEHSTWPKPVPSATTTPACGGPCSSSSSTRDDQASYVDVARSLLAACEAPDPARPDRERLPGLRAPHGHLRRVVHATTGMRPTVT